MKHLFVQLLLLQVLTLQAKAEFTTRQLNIPADGVTLCTQQLQLAINQLASKGGGRLVITPGRYLTGSLQLKSGVELHLVEGATILGSTNPYDYQPVHTDPTADTRNDNASMALITADRADHIALTGRGIIDGQGLQLALNADSLHHIGERPDAHYNTRRQRPSELVRPKLLFFYRCQNVIIDSLHLRSSANWGLSFDLCEQLTLQHLDIENRAYWNNDGIDLTDCRHVFIDDCNINAADDGVCLKSYHTTAPPCTVCGNATATCHAIEVSNCHIRSSASAVKFGTASWGAFHNIHVHDITIADTFRSCIAIESVDGAAIDSVLVEHIFATNTGNAIFLRLGQRAGQRKGSLRNIVIRDLQCEIPFGRPDEAYDLRGPEVDFFHNPFPSSICGIPDNSIENVLLENISISYPGRATRGMAYVPLWRASDIPEQIEKYPEFSMFGELPSWAFYVRHARNVTFRNVNVTLRDSDFRPAFVFDDVQGIRMQQINQPESQVYSIRSSFESIPQ